MAVKTLCRISGNPLHMYASTKTAPVLQMSQPSIRRKSCHVRPSLPLIHRVPFAKIKSEYHLVRICAVRCNKKRCFASSKGVVVPGRYVPHAKQHCYLCLGLLFIFRKRWQLQQLREASPCLFFWFTTTRRDLWCLPACAYQVGGSVQGRGIDAVQQNRGWPKGEPCSVPGCRLQ